MIVTGGDPFILSPRRLRDLMARLARIDHVKVVRFHTRVPAVAPEMITPALVSALKAPGKAVYVALHANHARELTDDVRAACARIVDAGIPMIGQTVLLKGVNDDPEVLAALMRAMVETRIKPYYLHHGDLAPGTSHLRTTIWRRAREGPDAGHSRGTVSGLCQAHLQSSTSPAATGRPRRGGPLTISPRAPVWRTLPGARHAYPPQGRRLMAWDRPLRRGRSRSGSTNGLGQSGVCSRRARRPRRFIERGLVSIDGEQVVKDTGPQDPCPARP